MTATQLPVPGSKGGPCAGPCEHRECAAVRAQAARRCRVCGNVIGYATMYYREDAADGGVTFIHETCLAREATGRRLDLGAVVATPAALRAIALAGDDYLRLLARHRAGDWGTVPPEDWRANDWALIHGERILSAYTLASGEKVWVITEWDRSATTILLPEEY